MTFYVFGASSWIIAFFAAAFAVWIRYRWEKFAFFRRRGIPGPAPSVLDGNYRQLTHCSTSQWLVIEEWIQKYGKVFGIFRTGPAPILIVADHEMIKDILIKDFSHFADRTILRSPKSRLPRIFRSNLTILTGQDWKRVRSTLTPTFTAKKMKAMSPTINKIVDILLSTLEAKANSGETTDIYNLFQGLTLDVIGNCAFGMDVDCQRNPGDPFFESVRGMMRSAGNPFVRIIQMFPEFNILIARFLRYLNPNRKRGNLLEEKLEKVIRQRKEGSQLTDHVDMVQLMIEASEESSTEQAVNNDSSRDTFSDVRKKYLTEEEMVANSFIFLVAGYETTANCLGFTAYLLAKHPDIQERVFEEIRDVVGLTVTPDYDRVQQLPYLEMVVSESLRILPPVSSFVTRAAAETVIINGHTIPARTVIEVPLWHLHHDPEVWQRPFEFDPERFSPENKPAIPPMAYLPFGAGPRNCIGMRFAQLEIKLALVRILQKYHIATCPESEPEIQLQPGLATINPKNGVFVQIVKR